MSRPIAILLWFGVYVSVALGSKYKKGRQNHQSQTHLSGLDARSEGQKTSYHATTLAEGQNDNLTVYLRPGWTFFSLNVIAENTAGVTDMKVNSVLDSLNLTTGDVIKNKFTFSQYIEGWGWWGHINVLDVHDAYMIKLNKSNRLVVRGRYALSANQAGGTTMTTTLSLHSGWGYFPCMYQEETALQVALPASACQWSTGDIIKTETASAQYSVENSTWFGLLSALQPGVGYAYRFANACNLSVQHPQVQATSLAQVPAQPVMIVCEQTWPQCHGQTWSNRMEVQSVLEGINPLPVCAVGGSSDCVNSTIADKCIVGALPRCPSQQITWYQTHSYQECQSKCGAHSDAISFWWWPTSGCSCSKSAWEACPTESTADFGVVSGNLTCLLDLELSPDLPCYNSYSMIWKEFTDYNYAESSDGVQYGININLDNCFKICSSIDACIGIKWTVQNQCWLQTWAFYSEPSSCGDALVFRKEFVNSVVQAPTNKACACDAVTCQQISQCFTNTLNAPANAGTGGARELCEEARNYRGTLSELRAAKKDCDVVLRTCSVQWPACYRNMTLSWEQGLVHNKKNQGNAGSSTSLLLQRSGRGLSSQNAPTQPEVLRLTATEVITSDANQDGKLDFPELLAMLRNDAWFTTDGASEASLSDAFASFDSTSDNTLCCVDHSTGNLNGELKAFVEYTQVEEYCFACLTSQSVPFLLTQVSEMDKSGREDDLDHAVSNMNKSGLQDELDNVYKKKRCR